MRYAASLCTLFWCMPCATESAFLYFLVLFVEDDDLINCVNVMVLWVKSFSCRMEFAMCFELLIVFLLFSVICASRRISLIVVEKIPKNPANNILATLACLLNCVYSVCVTNPFK